MLLIPGLKKAFGWILEGFEHEVVFCRLNHDGLWQRLLLSSVEIWYLHGPDRTVPYEETMRVVNDLYKEGYFKKFGLSNFASYVWFWLVLLKLLTKHRWEVAEIVTIAKANGYILPTVYQGVYNAIHRVIEPELLPCLRKFGISFYAFNPCEFLGLPS